MSKLLNYLLGIVILVAVAGGIFYFHANAKEKNKEVTEKAKPVKTMTVEKKEHHIVRSFPGKVRASKRVNLSFEVGGVLRKLPITEGMQVKKDQLIAKLDQRTFENNLLAAKAAFTEAEINLNRQKKLLKEKVVAKSILDSAQSNYDTAHAKYKIAQKNLEDTELRAPFDGIIAKRYVENHTKVNALQDIASLQDTSNIEIVIQVPESIMVYANEEAKNSEFKVCFDAIPEKEFTVKIHEYSLDADSQTQTYDVVLIMPTSDKYNFLPGMTASVTTDKFLHPDEKDLNHIWLPTAAILGKENNNKSYVFIIGKNNRAIKKYIKIGMPTTAGVPILSGLDVGDIVVIAGSKYIQEDMLLRPL